MGTQSGGMMKQLLLISNSKTFGGGYLTHCEAAISHFFRGVKTVLFVPYALKDRDGYTKLAQERFKELGFQLSSVHQALDPIRAVRCAEAIFVGGGNTFRLLRLMYQYRIAPEIRSRVRAGMPYMGSSAGSNVACPTICTTNDMPIVFPGTLAALDLIPFQINPHYLDPDPNSQHMGETRETRIKEFHEENDTPVIGLREGSWLRVVDNEVILEGKAGARIFIKGVDPFDIAAGSIRSALRLQ